MSGRAARNVLVCGDPAPWNLDLVTAQRKTSYVLKLHLVTALDMLKAGDLPQSEHLDKKRVHSSLADQAYAGEEGPRRAGAIAAGRRDDVASTSIWRDEGRKDRGRRRRRHHGLEGDLLSPSRRSGIASGVFRARRAWDGVLDCSTFGPIARSRLCRWARLGRAGDEAKKPPPPQLMGPGSAETPGSWGQPARNGLESMAAPTSRGSGVGPG